MRHKLIVLLALLALMLGLPGVARAGGDDGDGGQSGNNAAVAINTKSGSSLFKFAFAIRRVLGDVVDNQNAAVAYSSCETCRTTAIAIQIVFVVGSPSTVTPTNLAVALNENCTACQSFAAAFQFVVGVPDASVGFTKQGKEELREILRAFKELKREDYTLAEFDARTKALAERLRTLLRTQLVSRAGGGDDGDDDESEDVEDEAEEDERPAPPPPPATTGADTATGGTTTQTAEGTESTPTTTTSTEPPPTVTETETETDPGTTTTTP